MSWPRDVFEALRQIVLIEHRVEDMSDTVKQLALTCQDLIGALSAWKPNSNCSSAWQLLGVPTARFQKNPRNKICWPSSCKWEAAPDPASRSAIAAGLGALVRVRLAGICNTDVEILRGYHQFLGVPGHEFVGEVVEVAGVPAAIRKRWLGERVAGEINVSCSAYNYKPVCDFCRRGLKTHCARRTMSSESLPTTAPSPNIWRSRWKIFIRFPPMSPTRRPSSSNLSRPPARFSSKSRFANFPPPRFWATASLRS